MSTELTGVSRQATQVAEAKVASTVQVIETQTTQQTTHPSVQYIETHAQDPSRGELQRDVGRVEGKIDGILLILTGIKSDNAATTARSDLRTDHLSDRVGKVENNQKYFAGGVAAFAAVVAMAAKFWPFH